MRTFAPAIHLEVTHKGRLHQLPQQRVHCVSVDLFNRSVVTACRWWHHSHSICQQTAVDKQQAHETCAHSRTHSNTHSNPAQVQQAGRRLLRCSPPAAHWRQNLDGSLLEAARLAPYGVLDARLVASSTSQCLLTLQLQVPLSPCRCGPSGAVAWDDSFGGLTTGDCGCELVMLCADAARRGRCHMLTAGCSTLHGAFRMVTPSSLRYFTSSVRRYERKHSTATYRLIHHSTLLMLHTAPAVAGPQCMEGSSRCLACANG
jgi:hypothetical protein